jgi:hypothetical protein
MRCEGCELPARVRRPSARSLARPTGRWVGAVLVGVLVAPGSAAAVRSIDPYRFDYPGSVCSQDARPGALGVLQWLVDHDAVGVSGGIYACRPIQGTNILSLHAEGRAVDWVLDNRDARQRKIADSIVAALLKRGHGHSHALARRMGIQEIIWNCRIWRSDQPDFGLARYTPCSTSADRTVRHENHFHVGLNHDGAEQRTSFWTRGYWPPDLLAIKSGVTRSETRLLDGGTTYRSLLSRQSISLSGASTRPDTFLYGDYDNDWVDDLFAIRHTGSRQFRVLVFSGASHFRSRLLAANTALVGASARRYAFGLGDYDHDGRLDIYAIENRAAGSTEIRVLNGAGGYRSVFGSVRTPLPEAPAGTFQFAIGDRDNDGFDDVYAIRQRHAAPTEVYVLDGAAGFGSLEGPIRISKPRTTSGNLRFLVGDQNGDGHDDIYGISYRPRTRTAEVYALAGPWFGSYDLHARIVLAPPSKGGWEFALPAQPGL